jgi:hypothetical protein
MDIIAGVHAHGKVSRCNAGHHKSFAYPFYRFAETRQDKLSHLMAFNPRSLFGIDCVQCGHELIAPTSTAYLDVQLIRHLWECPRCYARFESIPRFPRDAKRVSDLKRKVDVFPGWGEA